MVITDRYSSSNTGTRHVAVAGTPNRGTYDMYALLIARDLPYRTVYITPLLGLFKLDRSSTKRMPIPNDRSPESSRRDASNADFFGTHIYPSCADIEHGK